MIERDSRKEWIRFFGFWAQQHLRCSAHAKSWSGKNKIPSWKVLGRWEGRVKYDLKSNLKVERDTVLLSLLPQIWFLRFHISLNKLLYREQYILLPNNVAPALTKELLKKRCFFSLCTFFCMFCLLSFLSLSLFVLLFLLLPPALISSSLPLCFIPPVDHVTVLFPSALPFPHSPQSSFSCQRSYFIAVCLIIFPVFCYSTCQWPFANVVPLDFKICRQL